MKLVKLGKVAKIDRTVATNHECQTLPYVGLEHIEKDAGSFSADFERSSETLLATKFRFTPKHVLYGKLRPYLNKVALPSFDGVCTTEVLPILPFEDKLDRTYLWALLLTPKFVSWASRIVSGANLPRLSPSDLGEFEVPLPSLLEQKRLAAVLAKADRLRRLRRYALTVSDTYLQTAFTEMFGDPIRNPKSWKLKEMGDEINNIRYGTGSPPTYQKDGIPFIRATNIKRGTVIDKDMVFFLSRDADKFKKCRIEKGDLIIVRSGANTGDSGLIPERYHGAYAAYDLIVELPSPQNVYYNHVINSSFGKAIIEPLSRRAGSATPKCRAGKRVDFPFPAITPSAKIRPNRPTNMNGCRLSSGRRRGRRRGCFRRSCTGHFVGS